MKIVYLILLCMFFTGSTIAADADTYKISGTVTKKGGGPLEGVTVYLKGKNVSVITGADGAFELSPPIALRMKAPQVQPLSFQLQGNAVKFSRVDGSLNGNVSIFTGNGKRVTSIDFSNLNPMRDQITIPRLASGLNIFRVTINNIVHTSHVVRLGRELQFTNHNVASKNDNMFTLAKIKAAEVIDTLIATKENFQDSKTPIQSYTQSDISIEMDSIKVVEGIAWGREENPTAHCKVDALPEYSTLKANSKLPDPFLKLDGTRIKDKSEWACRREEIYQQMLKYIYGDKPVPSKSSVSGTVSTSKISVTVNENGKSCSFDVTVKMNGASQPAPAIIRFGDEMFGPSGASAPSGVAEISFKAIEAQGNSGAKTGPFFTLYGSDHPAGYLTAQAWQVSRIIDVLEQNPGIIDPFRIAVTGCSRNGKGAFIAGVLDNRIALTIPVESGIGGTVALRLVEKLDTGGEWPYHAISYVRWLSETALGKFTSGNNANSDNTDRLPVDMHEAMALIAPRGLYIVDNPSTNYPGLDARSAWVTAKVGKSIFEALGVGDNFAYEGASGSHCQWRTPYTASLNAMVDKFLKGDSTAKTGTFNTDLGNKPTAEQHFDWSVPTLDGAL